jgi:hypothetical protein
MKHLWNGVAAAMVSLAATAPAQTPLSPSGAVNSTEPPAIGFPGAAPSSSDRRPPADRVTRPPSPAPRSAPAETARTPAAAAGAAPDETATSRTEAASSPDGDHKTAVSRPKRPARDASRSAASRGERYPGDNVADMLNARELNQLSGGGGPVPVARPMGPPGYPPPGYTRPPVFGPPGYVAPPGYAPPPYPPMMRPPY